MADAKVQRARAAFRRNREEIYEARKRADELLPAAFPIGMLVRYRRGESDVCVVVAGHGTDGDLIVENMWTEKRYRLSADRVED